MRLAHEDDHLACVDKPCDIRLSVPRGGVAWTGEEGAPGGPWAGPASGLPCPEVTVHEWLKEHVPQVVTPGGEVRLCHQLDLPLTLTLTLTETLTVTKSLTLTLTLTLALTLTLIKAAKRKEDRCAPTPP